LPVRLTAIGNRVEFISMRLPTDCFVVARISVVIFAVVMLLGHICVLPTHRHVETAPGHGDEAQPHDADEAVHAGSCEVLRSSGIACPAVVAISAFIVPTPGEPLKQLIGRRGMPSLPTPSPPLFLLHAALLI
jgi:hypothetical protein